jgi:hypothetical protein
MLKQHIFSSTHYRTLKRRASLAIPHLRCVTNLFQPSTRTEHEKATPPLLARVEHTLLLAAKYTCYLFLQDSLKITQM